MIPPDVITIVERGIAYLRDEGTPKTPVGRERLELTARQMQLFLFVQLMPGKKQDDYRDKMGVDRQSITQAADRLCDDLGWVERINDPEDRRANLMYITSKGQRVLDRMKKELQ
jgi:DNA-binding MarR family transcriptional regulator